MITMACDPSLTGFYVIVADDERIVFEEMFTSPTFESLSVRGRVERYRWLADKVHDVVCRHEPTWMLIEGCFTLKTRGNSTQFLSEMRGVVLDRLVDVVPSVREVAPVLLKIFATGKGVGKKIAIATALTHRYGRQFENDNEADCFGLHRLALCVAGVVEPANAKQADVASRIHTGPVAKPTKASKKKAA